MDRRFERKVSGSKKNIAADKRKLMAQSQDIASQNRSREDIRLQDVSGEHNHRTEKSRDVARKKTLIHEYYTRRCIIYIFKEEKSHEHT